MGTLPKGEGKKTLHKIAIIFAKPISLPEGEGLAPPEKSYFLKTNHTKGAKNENRYFRRNIFPDTQRTRESGEILPR